MIPPPESAESRERWHAALDEYLARKARTEQLRRELAAARAAGKARRHANRLRRARVGDTTTEGDKQVTTTQIRDGGTAVVVQHCADTKQVSMRT